MVRSGVLVPRSLSPSTGVPNLWCTCYSPQFQNLSNQMAKSTHGEIYFHSRIILRNQNPYTNSTIQVLKNKLLEKISFSSDFSLIKLINLPFSEWIQSMRDCKFTFYSSSFHNIWLKCFTMRSISEVVWSRDISAFQIWLLKRGSRPQAPLSLPKDGSPAPRAHATTLYWI